MGKTLTLAEAAAKGGKSKSKIKVLASRKNGKKGGRPKQIITKKFLDRTWKLMGGKLPKQKK